MFCKSCGTQCSDNAVQCPKCGEPLKKSNSAGEKSPLAAWLLWWFLGLCGGHRFYLGKPVSGIIYFLTFGILGIGWFIDLFLLSGMIKAANNK